MSSNKMVCKRCVIKHKTHPSIIDIWTLRHILILIIKNYIKCNNLALTIPFTDSFIRSNDISPLLTASNKPKSTIALP